MKKQIICSVIIPVYEGSNVVSRAINSVLSQTYQNFELIIVNDGSTDNTEEVVKAIKDDRIKYFVQENKGQSSARNKGIKEATGEYIAFLDADDYWSPSHLSDHVNFLENNPDYVMSFNRYFTVEKGKEKLYAWKNNLRGNIYPQLLFIKNNIIGTPCVVVRKNILEKSGLFDESMAMCEDLDLWRRISKHGKVKAISKPSTYVVLREGQFEPKRYLEGRYEYIKKAMDEDTDLVEDIFPLLLLEMWYSYASSNTSLVDISENIKRSCVDYPNVGKNIQKKIAYLNMKSWLNDEIALSTMEKDSRLYKFNYALRLLKSQGIFTTLKNIYLKIKNKVK